MGVKNLSKLLQKYCPETLLTTSLPKYKNQTVGIDASIFFYKFLYVSNKYNKPNYYLHLFFQQIMDMLQQNMLPIYIFDGKPPPAKEDEQKKRKETRENRRDKIDKEQDYVQQLKKTLDNITVVDDSYHRLADEIQTKQNKVKAQEDTIILVTDQHKTNLKALLTILAIPFVQGHAETDPLSAQLCKEGLVDAILSEDMDYLALGCTRLLRTKRSSPDYQEGYEKELIEYNHQTILEGLGLTQLEFIDLCILCGCDYVDQLSKIGPMTAYQLVKDHKNIEQVLTKIDKLKHQVPSNYMDLVHRARQCFQKTYNHKITKPMLCRRTPNLPRIRDFMTRFCNYNTYTQDKYCTLLSL